MPGSKLLKKVFPSQISALVNLVGRRSVLEISVFIVKTMRRR